MSDAALKSLFESLKPSHAGAEDAPEPAADEEAETPAAGSTAFPTAPPEQADIRQRSRTRAETWARRAAEVAGLVHNRRSPDFETQLAATAKRLVARVVDIPAGVVLSREGDAWIGRIGCGAWRCRRTWAR